MKVWVVRNSAFSVQCGGLERLFIHFAKPVYYYEKLTEKDRDLPFGDILEQEGLFKKVGWKSDNKTWVQPLSVGNWIGYDNPISTFIWNKLKEHFNNEPFDTWHRLEKDGKCKIEDFLLEIELEINLSNMNIKFSEIKKYLTHLPYCNLRKDWLEADQALADTPDQFRDAEYYTAIEELEQKKITCTCGLKEIFEKESLGGNS